MAVVPYRQTSELSATQTPAPYQNIPVDADMFGAAVGAGMQNLAKSIAGFGDTMEQNSLKIQSRLNEAHSEELFNGATVALGKLDAEQGQLAGKARYDAYNSYVEKAQAIRKQFLDSAGNMESARLFDRQFSRRLAYGIVNESGKAATALQQYENDAKTNKLKLLTEEAGRSQDEASLDLNLKQIDETVDQTRDLPSNKWSPEHTEVVRGQLHDQAMMNFLQNLTLSNPMRAQGILEKYKDNFQDPKNFNAIKAKVDQGMLRAGTRQDADEIWKSVKPPSGPVDRSNFKGELQDDNVVRKLAEMVVGETGKFSDDKKDNQIIQLETAFNRAQARGIPLSQALLSVGEDPKKGYYARDTYTNHAPLSDKDIQYFKDNILAPVIGGSNVGKEKLGFTPTGNASGNFALGREASGTYANSAWPSGQPGVGEMYALERADANKVAALETGVASDASPMTGVPLAQNTPPNVKNDFVSPDTLGNALSKVDDYAAKRYPDDPGMQALYRDELITRLKTNYSTDRSVLKEQRNARFSIVFSELIPQAGQKGPTQLEQLSPQAYLAYQDMDALQQRAVNKQLESNAKSDVPLTPERFSRFQQVMGLSVSNQDQFLDIAPGELDIPRTLQSQIFNKQRQLQKGLDQSKINNVLRNVQPLLNDAGIFASRTDTAANDKYNQFVGALDQKLTEFRDTNKREPKPDEQRQMTVGLMQDVAGSGWFGTSFGGRKSFEVPGTWGQDSSGNALTTDRVITDFKARYNRPPTSRELFNLYQNFKAK